MDAQEVELTLTPLPPPSDLALAVSKHRLLSPLLKRTITLSTKTSDSSYVILGRSSHNVAKKLVPAAENGYFDSPNISRQHATIFIDNSRYRVLKVRDTGSLHGTYLYGERVPKDGIVLVNQDVINLGTKIIYEGDVIPPQRILVSFKWLPLSSSLKAVAAPVSGFGIQELSDSEADITATDFSVDVGSSAAASPGPSYQAPMHSSGKVDDKENRQPITSTIQCALTKLTEFADKSLQFNKPAIDLRQWCGRTETVADKSSSNQLEHDPSAPGRHPASDSEAGAGRVTEWMRPLLMGFAASPTLNDSPSESEKSVQIEAGSQDEYVNDVPHEVEIEQPKEDAANIQVEEHKETCSVLDIDSAVEGESIKMDNAPEAVKSDDPSSSVEIIEVLSSTPAACEPEQPQSPETASRRSIEQNSEDQSNDAIEPIAKEPKALEDGEPVETKRRFSDIEELPDEEVDNSPRQAICSKRRRLGSSSTSDALTSSPAAPSSPSTPALMGRYAAATAVGVVIGSVGTFAALVLSEFE
ncbi:hypothetical protein POJ06DRAFT_51923 [Lipomyces tetrasporus]|uniref:FHA domain-containing protein n=1 Tax=Lipomyces tetrasporus TaxID=54092 RepID=A0AAD7QX86_9ASCO|nr:uncharacterized protein POJ06DRAFT_51923 [Lipomyces tetrasporus]KAJ8102576.1 hypothetical protein POJ06DRAFT_51923 [Lipomyces tetrasporus]